MGQYCKRAVRAVPGTVPTSSPRTEGSTPPPERERERENRFANNITISKEVILGTGRRDGISSETNRTHHARLEKIDSSANCGLSVNVEHLEHMDTYIILFSYRAVRQCYGCGMYRHHPSLMDGWAGVQCTCTRKRTGINAGEIPFGSTSPFRV